MCEHHHAAKHILCSQCDMLVALPRLEHRQKAACPRCGTTLTVAWDALGSVRPPMRWLHCSCCCIQLVSFCEYERCRSYQ